MLFKEVKTSYTYEKEPFASNFYTESICRINNDINNYILMNEEFNELINESILFEDALLLNESCKDYISNVERYLKDTLKYVDSMWNKFSMEHNLAKQSNSRLIAKSINAIDISGNYTFTGYRYTISDENIHIDRYLTQSQSQIRQQLENDLSALKERLDKDDYYDKLRGKFVGETSTAAEDFAKALHKKYRDGRFRPTQITVDQNMKNEMIDAIFEVDNNLSSCIHLKNDIDNYIKSVMRYFNNLKALAENSSDEIRRNHDMTTFKLTDIEELAQIQMSITKRILNIYVLVLSAKLDAVNERQRKYSKELKNMIQQYESRGDDDDDE